MTDGLTFEAERVAGNSAMANAIDDMTHWNCTLSGDGASFSFVVSLATEDFGERAPDRDDAIAYLTADLETLEQFPDRSVWLREMASQVGLDIDAPALALAHEMLSETAAGIEMNFSTSWQNVLSPDFTPDPRISPNIPS